MDSLPSSLVGVILELRNSVRNAYGANVEKGEMRTNSGLLAARAYKEAGWRDGTGRSAWFG